MRGAGQDLAASQEGAMSDWSQEEALWDTFKQRMLEDEKKRQQQRE